MTQAQLPYLLLYLFSTFLASVSQVLLKKAALREHKSLLAEYTDWRVILGYGQQCLMFPQGGDVPRNLVCSGTSDFGDLDEAFAQSDIVSLHCPLNDESKHLIDKNAIARMKEILSEYRQKSRK